MNRGKIKVAINAITDLRPTNGSKVYLLALAEALSRVPNIELQMLVGEGQSAQLAPSLRPLANEIGIPSSHSYWQAILQRRIDRYLRCNQIDIYHVPNTCPVFRKSTRTVITIHDLVDLKIATYNRARTLYRRVANYTAARAADLILTVSNNSKRDIVDLLQVPTERVGVVYPGVGAEFRPLNREECGRDLSSRYPVKGKFIFAPGGLALNKNVTGLLTSFAELCWRGSDHQLVFTGVADRRKLRSWLSVVKRLGLGNRVVFTGHVVREDMPKFYNAASATAYVSLYEGFGLPLLESMACGTPMVVSNCSSIPEVVDDAALKVNPYDTGAIRDSLTQLLCNPGLYSRLSARGIERASAFSWTQTAQQTADAYFSLMGKEQRSIGSVLAGLQLNSGVNTSFKSRVQ